MPLETNIEYRKRKMLAAIIAKKKKEVHILSSISYFPPSENKDRLFS
jgi:hypothetical protein